MFNYIKSSIQWDKDIPERAKTIDLYTRVYEGTIYDHLNNYYFEERTNSGDYIPLHQRQPSHKTNFCKLVADNSVSLLFGSDHFPKITSPDDKLRQALEDIIKEYKLNKIMTRAATIGSTGSVAIIIRIYEGILNIQTMNTKYLTPVFDKKYPDKLILLTERYKVKGDVLIANGYQNIKEPSQNYWFHREWNRFGEIYYIPYLCSEKNPKKTVDEEKSSEHTFDFVPAIWIKNLTRIVDSDENGAIVDGACTFKSAIDTNIEIDYQMSQLGRALKYSADPLLVLKLEDDMVMQQNMIMTSDSATGSSQRKLARSANNAMILSKDDEAKLLEISGDACTAVLEFVRTSRELLLESIQGNRSNADKVNAAQSGRAMQAMNQALIWLTDHLRVSYGEGGLLVLLQMIIEITNIPGYAISVDGKQISALNKAKIGLNWPAWYPSTPADKVQDASAVKTNIDAGVLSTDTGTKAIAADYNIENTAKEKTEIEKDQEKIAARLPKLTQVQNI